MGQPVEGKLCKVIFFFAERENLFVCWKKCFKKYFSSLYPPWADLYKRGKIFLIFLEENWMHFFPSPKADSCHQWNIPENCEMFLFIGD